MLPPRAPRFSEGGALFANWDDESDGPLPQQVHRVRDLLKVRAETPDAEIPELLAAQGLIPPAWCEHAVPMLYSALSGWQIRSIDGPAPPLMTFDALCQLAERPERKVTAEEIMRSVVYPGYEQPLPVVGWFRMAPTPLVHHHVARNSTTICVRALSLEPLPAADVGLYYPSAAERGFQTASWRNFFDALVTVVPDIAQVLDLGVVPWVTSRGLYLSVAKDFQDSINFPGWFDR